MHILQQLRQVETLKIRVETIAKKAHIPGTIDERVMKALECKDNMQAALSDAVKA